MAVRIGLEIDEDVLQQVIDDLELRNAPTFVLNHSGRIQDHPDIPNGRFWGLYDPSDNTVSIATGLAGFKHETITVLTGHLKRTLLHELRHAYQREHWDEEMKQLAKRGSYKNRIEEIDANKYADNNQSRFPGLVRVRRHATASSRPRLPQDLRRAR